jgi:hypothetical protein
VQKVVGANPIARFPISFECDAELLQSAYRADLVYWCHARVQTGRGGFDPRKFSRFFQVGQTRHGPGCFLGGGGTPKGWNRWSTCSGSSVVEHVLGKDEVQGANPCRSFSRV